MASLVGEVVEVPGEQVLLPRKGAPDFWGLEQDSGKEAGVQELLRAEGRWRPRGSHWLPSVRGGSSLLRDSLHPAVRRAGGESRGPGMGKGTVEGATGTQCHSVSQSG